MRKTKPKKRINFKELFPSRLIGPSEDSSIEQEAGYYIQLALGSISEMFDTYFDENDSWNKKVMAACYLKSLELFSVMLCAIDADYNYEGYVKFLIDPDDHEFNYDLKRLSQEASQFLHKHCDKIDKYCEAAAERAYITENIQPKDDDK